MFTIFLVCLLYILVCLPYFLVSPPYFLLCFPILRYRPWRRSLRVDTVEALILSKVKACRRTCKPFGLYQIGRKTDRLLTTTPTFSNSLMTSKSWDSFFGGAKSSPHLKSGKRRRVSRSSSSGHFCPWIWLEETCQSVRCRSDRERDRSFPQNFDPFLKFHFQNWFFSEKGSSWIWFFRLDSSRC